MFKAGNRTGVEHLIQILFSITKSGPTKTFHQLIMVARRIVLTKILRPNSGSSKINSLINVRYVTAQEQGLAVCWLSLHCHTGSGDDYLRTQNEKQLRYTDAVREQYFDRTRSSYSNYIIPRTYFGL